MTGDTMSPATTVSRWPDLPDWVRLCGYARSDSRYYSVTPPRLFKRTSLAKMALDRKYRGMIVRSKGVYYLSKPDGTLLPFTHKSAALAALRMMDV